MKYLFILLASTNLYAAAIQMHELEELNRQSTSWGEAPCAPCLELEQLTQAPEQLTEEEVFALSKSQLQALNPEFLRNPPSDIKRQWCPKYNNLSEQQKLTMWSWLLTGMSYHESKHRPHTAYDESQTDPSLNGVVSTGLLQISFNSSQARLYKNHGCPIEERRDLKSPTKNLGCGVAIISGLIERDQCFSCQRNKGAAAYWSVLRDPYTVTNRAGRTINIGKKDKLIQFVKEKMPQCH